MREFDHLKQLVALGDETAKQQLYQLYLDNDIFDKDFLRLADEKLHFAKNEYERMDALIRFYTSNEELRIERVRQRQEFYQQVINQWRLVNRIRRKLNLSRMPDPLDKNRHHYTNQAAAEIGVCQCHEVYYSLQEDLKDFENKTNIPQYYTEEMIQQQIAEIKQELENIFTIRQRLGWEFAADDPT